MAYTANGLVLIHAVDDGGLVVAKRAGDVYQNPDFVAPSADGIWKPFSQLDAARGYQERQRVLGAGLTIFQRAGIKWREVG
jgi:hypothetical protein